MPFEPSMIELGEGTIIDPSATVGVLARDGSSTIRIGPGSVIRSHAVIYCGIVAGARLQVGHGALIRENNIFGDDCTIGTNASIEPGNRLGTRCRIHSGAFLSSVTAGDDVFIGPGVVFTDDPHPPCPRYLDCLGGAVVEERVSIGANATILPGLRIGHDSLVGAGSVVVEDVPPESVVAGNPARVVKKISELRCYPGLFSHPYEWRSKASGNG